MDDSVPTATKSTDSARPAQHWVMGRAIASAAVFGSIGAGIGHWLGKNLKNNIAEAAFKWSMGAFWAVIAAYSSLKASAIARGERVTESPAVNVTLAPKMVPELSPETKIRTPLSLIEVDTLKDQGLVQTAPELQRS